MDLQLNDKVIIVSGGAKGIGEGIVKVLAAEGAIPVIIGRSEEDNLLTVKAIEAAGGKFRRITHVDQMHGVGRFLVNALERGHGDGA